VSSVSGDVELETDSSVRVETHSLTGDVKVDGPHRTEGGRGNRTVIVGDGSAVLSVSTTSGDVRVRSAARGAADPQPPDAPEPPVIVAEAVAAPNLVREVPADGGGDGSGLDRREAARLEVLRALERGELDVEEASHRLEILEDAGPRAFRGWC
jgi:hypothetical protein